MRGLGPLGLGFLVWLLLVGTALAAQDKEKREPRVLTDWSIVEDEALLRVKLSISGNDNQPLGHVVYNGRQVRVTLANTLLDPETPRKLDGKHPSVEKMEVRTRSKSEVDFFVTVFDRELADPEHIVFSPGKEGSVIEFRKPAFYKTIAREVPAIRPPTATQAAATKAQDEPLPAPAPKPPLEAPAATKPDTPPTAVPLPRAEPVPTAQERQAEAVGEKKREETLTSLFGAEAGKAQAPAAKAAKPDPRATQPLSIGGDSPDFSSLYIMAGVLVLLGAGWLVISRGKGFSLSRRLDDASLKVLKQQSIGGRQRLLLVEAEGRRLLLAATDRDLRLLVELDPRQDPDQVFGSAVARQTPRNTLFDPPTESEPFYPARVNNPPGHPQPLSRKASGERPSFFNKGEEEAEPAPEPAPGDDDASLRDRLRALRQRR